MPRKVHLSSKTERKRERVMEGSMKYRKAEREREKQDEVWE